MTTEEAPRESVPSRNPDNIAPDKPTGGHPVVAVVGAISILTMILWVVIPNPKDQPINPTTGETKSTPGMTSGTPMAPHVSSQTVALLPEFNAVAVLVPPDTTDEQVRQLLLRFKKARFDETLVQYIPPTSKGDKLGPHAIADIYIFSEKDWATVESLKVLAKGPHSAGVENATARTSFSEVTGRVRGHYVINQHEADRRDRGSLGYADEDGGNVGKNYQELF